MDDVQSRPIDKQVCEYFSALLVVCISVHFAYLYTFLQVLLLVITATVFIKDIHFVPNEMQPVSVHSAYRCTKPMHCVTHFWATVCKMVRPMLSVHCLSILSVCRSLSVTLVYCGQTVGQIKMKLGMQVGLGPGHTVLGGGPAPPPLKGHSPPIFGPYLLRPNGCMDQDVTWYGSRPRPR